MDASLSVLIRHMDLRHYGASYGASVRIQTSGGVFVLPLHDTPCPPSVRIQAPQGWLLLCLGLILTHGTLDTTGRLRGEFGAPSP